MWSWYQLSSLLGQLEALAPMSEVIHSLHFQGAQIPEIASLPEWGPFTRAVTDTTYYRLAASGFIRRILWGDGTPEVWSGLVESLRQLAESQRTFTRTVDALLARPAVADVVAMRALRQVVMHLGPAQRGAMSLARIALGLLEPLD